MRVTRTVDSKTILSESAQFSDGLARFKAALGWQSQDGCIESMIEEALKSPKWLEASFNEAYFEMIGMSKNELRNLPTRIRNIAEDIRKLHESEYLKPKVYGMQRIPMQLDLLSAQLQKAIEGIPSFRGLKGTPFALHWVGVARFSMSIFFKMKKQAERRELKHSKKYYDPEVAALLNAAHSALNPKSKRNLDPAEIPKIRQRYKTNPPKKEWIGAFLPISEKDSSPVNLTDLY